MSKRPAASKIQFEGEICLSHAPFFSKAHYAAGVSEFQNDYLVNKKNVLTCQQSS